MATFKAIFPVLQKLFAKNHRGALCPPPSGARVNPSPSPPGRLLRPVLTDLEHVVGEDEHLEALQVLDVVRHLGQLVGAQVQLHHMLPGADIHRQGRQQVVLHVQLGQVPRSREDAVRDLVDLVVLHIDGVDVCELKIKLSLTRDYGTRQCLPPTLFLSNSRVMASKQLNYRPHYRTAAHQHLASTKELTHKPPITPPSYQLPLLPSKAHSRPVPTRRQRSSPGPVRPPGS